MTFSDDLTTIRHMFVWVYAHRLARINDWMHVATDRERFRRRIGTMETILKRVLTDV